MEFIIAAMQAFGDTKIVKKVTSAVNSSFFILHTSLFFRTFAADSENPMHPMMSGEW
jgi:hypothetical protein